MSDEFVAYEYITVNVSKDFEPLYSDCYANFGWQPSNDESNSDGGSVTLKFKRDKKINNKSKLQRLQKECDESLALITRLEGQKTSSALSASLFIGILGACIVVGAVFSYIYGIIALCALLGGIGGVICVINCFIFGDIKKKVTQNITPKIERQYDLAYKACEQGKALLG